MRLNRGLKKVAAVVMAAAMFVGGTRELATKVSAANYPYVMYDTSYVTLVTDVDSGMAQRRNIGAYFSNYGDVLALPINLQNYSDGTLQVRIYTNSSVTGNMEAYLVEASDLYSAKRYSGIFNFSYRNVNMGSDVQGAALQANGRMIWNSWMKGGNNYYLVLTNNTQNKKVTRTDAEGKTETYEVGAIAHEDVSIEIVFEPAYIDSTNVLDGGKVVRKFMSLDEQDEQFIIRGSQDANSYVLYYTFDGERAFTGSGSVKVYNKNNELVADKTVSAAQANRRQELSLAIDNIERGGSYTVRTTGIYGFVTMRLEADTYKVKLSKDKTTRTNEVTITVDCGDMDYDSLIYVPWAVKESAKNSNSSFRDSVTITGNKFTVKENGDYTVRAMSGGKAYIATITIDNIDNVAPELKKIPSLTKKTVTLKTDASDLKSIVVNGRKVANGCRLTEEGEYDIVVSDKVGNTSTYSVMIDKTAPVIKGEGWKNKSKVARGSYLFSVTDDLSGIKSIIIDGAEQRVGNNGDTYSLYVQNEQHTIIVKDNVGNTRTWTIGLKPDPTPTPTPATQSTQLQGTGSGSGNSGTPTPTPKPSTGSGSGVAF